ncbi:MAG: DMT family transporter [Chloroflexi bacterium]|nr:DMT family transporter [Chloroflexota bacterium]
MSKGKNRGIEAAFISAVFLGLAPVFGRQAILMGFAPLAVVALRTSMAAGLLLAIILLFKREYLYIFSLGLAGCALAGFINGVGSLFYYMALGRLSASVGQLLYSLYPVFVVLWSFLDRQKPSKLTLLRIVLATLAIAFITNANSGEIDFVGVGMMLLASALYALHLPINQRVLYEVPAPTVTLYTLLSMSIVVVSAYFIFDLKLPVGNIDWTPVIGLTLVTFLSRLTLFLGVKHIGGMQTALLGLGELIVTVGAGYFLLGEKLSPLQWIGVVGLIASLLLVRFEKQEARKGPGGWLNWIRAPHQLPPDIPWGPHS